MNCSPFLAALTTTVIAVERDGEVTIEELGGYEEALSTELAALEGKLSDRKSLSQEEFDRLMGWAHELETRLQSVR